MGCAENSANPMFLPFLSLLWHFYLFPDIASNKYRNALITQIFVLFFNTPFWGDLKGRFFNSVKSADLTLRL
jgi:hypothetical protein|nr:MAG TPA: hypothetical protein [Caudoviricetes sp.]